MKPISTDVSECFAMTWPSSSRAAAPAPVDINTIVALAVLLAVLVALHALVVLVLLVALAAPVVLPVRLVKHHG